ncbi:hypothetical protein RRG08_026460 [Elysia crispata]|uniref:Solute carrier organic anion transporter family member n=1 Tax=Elysia crispata TaxID=231223 RepID=A0AAE1CS14_9GAST|nr:hypothetical protein RRG08_026460 [Elysia crispata]
MAFHQKPKTQIHASKLHVTRAMGNADDLDLDLDTVCGVGQWKTRSLQPLATINCFTAVNGVTYLMTSCVAAFLGSQLTTFEKQFGFSSRQTGLIMAASNIGYMACVLFVSHMGNSAHIPRALSIGGCCFGVSGIIAAVPYFLFSEQLNNELRDRVPAQTGSMQEGAPGTVTDRAMQGELCRVSGQLADIQCESLEGATSWSTSGSPQEHIAFISLAIIVTGMVIQGFGKGPRLSFAVTYVDNNTEKINTGFYSGIMITCSVMGPVLAFLAGGIFSQIYVTLEATDLDPKHPRWVGAWWLGYLTLGLITVAMSLPLQLFPRRLPSHRNNKTAITSKLGEVALPLLDSASSRQNKHATTEQLSSIKFNKVVTRLQALITFIKEFIACQIRLWKNPIFVLMNLCSACIIFAVSANGYTAKYLEQVFDMPAHVANYTMAARSFVATGLGTFLGGYLTRRMSMSALTALRFNVLVLLAGCLTSCAGFFIYCSQPKIRMDTSTSCNAKCHCSENSFFPVCGQDGLTYYSPCQAGCTRVYNKEHIYWYSGCSCIEGGTAYAGTCAYGCSSIYGYILFSALTAFCQTITIMPKIIVFIRCVNDKDKTASMGLQSFTNSLLGYLSGGLAFGSLIDGVCSVWGVTCGVRGHCLQYDNDLFRFRLHSYVTVSMALAFITALAGYVYARRTDCLSEDVMEKQS